MSSALRRSSFRIRWGMIPAGFFIMKVLGFYIMHKNEWKNLYILRRNNLRKIKLEDNL